MHEKRFDGEIEKLRSAERVKRLEVERVVDLCLEGGRAHNVLDIGVGSGLFAETFHRRGLQVSGIDANPAMISAARQFVPSGDFQEAAAEALPYPAAAFDLAFMGVVLHESDEPLKALQEARRVIKQRLCILEWPYVEGEFGPPLAHRLEPGKIKDLARQAGFERIEQIPLTDLVLYRLGG